MALSSFNVFQRNPCTGAGARPHQPRQTFVFRGKTSPRIGDRYHLSYFVCPQDTRVIVRILESCLNQESPRVLLAWFNSSSGLNNGRKPKSSFDVRMCLRNPSQSWDQTWFQSWFQMYRKRLAANGPKPQPDSWLLSGSERATLALALGPAGSRTA